MPFSFVDLFSGIGGFHAALARRGGELVLASDIDSRARTVYANTWLRGDASMVHGDIRSLTSDKCRSIPDHEVLTGGFPCQPFSKSGRQLGVNEERGQLFYSILKVLQYRRPKMVILENVRNLVGPRHRADYDRIVSHMRGLGYAVPSEPTILSPHRLPMQHGGAPQHRERVFIVGLYTGRRRSLSMDVPAVATKHEFADWDPRSWDLRSFLRPVTPTVDERKRLRIGDEANAAIDAWEDFVTTFVSHNRDATLPGFPMWTDSWKPRAKLRIPVATPDWKRALTLKNNDFYERNAQWIDGWMARVDLRSFSPSLRKFEWQAGRPRSIETCIMQMRPSGVRVKRPDYIPALVAINQTPVLGWERRELSVREATLLQGFPDSMDFSSQTRGDSLTQLGNAVHVGTADFVFGRAIALAERYDLEWTASINLSAEASTQVQ